jgi:polysaccharide export outer membrane protein
VTDARRPAPGKKVLENYVIEPPDYLLVEVLEALPGRPISGERLVRPDGKVTLGWYGDVHVAGLTIEEAKVRIIARLQKSLSDEVLGLVEKGEDGKPILVDPKDSEAVFVDVTGYNSKYSYIEGEVASPNRLPFTAADRVLDAIHQVGGILPSADRSGIKLIRSYPKDSPVQVLPIDYEQITMGADSSTNYQLMPGDRLVVPADPKAPHRLLASPAAPTSPSGPEQEHKQQFSYFDRKGESLNINIEQKLMGVENRLTVMDGTLKAILEKLENSDKPKQ